MRQTGKNVSQASNRERNRCVLQHIPEALIDLMGEHALEEITISQICEKAQVGRASFYRNFASKRDVIEKHLLVLIQEWGAEFEARGDVNAFSETLVNHFYKHKDFYLLLYRQGLSAMIYENLRVACRLHEAQSTPERYGKSMFAGMLFGWLDEWMRHGMPEIPEELALL